MTATSGERNPVERLAEDFLDRKRRGEQPSVSEYVDRHPDLAEEIRDLFPALLMMEELGDGSGGTTGSLAADGAAAGTRLSRLGDYRILREIGRGGMGVVYEAEQESLGRRVALKVLSAGALLDPKQVRRFEREAKAAARLHHTNIVPVFGVGHQDGHHYFVMQFITGVGLDVVLDDLRRLRQGKSEASPTARPEVAASRIAGLTAADVAQSLIAGQFAAEGPAADGSLTEPSDDAQPASANGSPAQSSSAVLSGTSALSLSDPDRHYYRSVARIGIQVAEALDYANRQGILHRDVKPSNLLLDNHGNVWVADFGLAKTSDADDLTHTGDILGTIRYMAPERFAGHGDARSDVYSLGLTLYELVALRPAYEASDRHTLMDRVLHEEPERLKKLAPGVPRDLETIVAKATARDPAMRYATAAALGEDLRRFVEDRPIRARRVSAAERLVRWCRRNRTLAASIGVAAAALMAVAVMSLLYARRQARHAAEQTVANQRIARLADDLQASLSQSKGLAADLKASLEVSDRRRVALTDERARTNFERGQGACERGEVGPGLLYFIESWRSAVEAGDPGLTNAARANLSAWRHQAPRLVRQFRSNDNSFTAAVAFSPDGKVLATALADNTVQLWDPATADPIGLPMTHPDRVSSMAFSPDSKTLLTGCTDKMTRLWDVTTGRPIDPPFAHGSSVNRVAFGPDGRTVLTASSDGRVQLWDVTSRAVIARPFTHQGFLTSLSLSPDGKTVLTSGVAGARLWDITTGNPTGVEFLHKTRVLGAVYSPDGKTVLTGSSDQTARLWDAATGNPIGTPLAHRGTVHYVAYSPDGKTVLTGSSEQAARLWDAATGSPIGMPSPNQALTYRVAYHPDARTVLTLAFDGAPRLWDVAAGGAVVGRPLSHQAEVRAFAFRPDGKAVVTGTADGTVQFWDTVTGRSIGVPLKHHGAVNTVAFSPDGRIALTASDDDRTARLWDAASGAPISRPLTHPDHVCTAAFSPDGTKVVTGCADGSVRLWDAASSKPIRAFVVFARNGHFRTMLFSPDGKIVLTAGGPGSGFGPARLWDTATGAAIGPEMRTTISFAAAFSRDGKTVTIATFLGLEVWDAASGRFIGSTVKDVRALRSAAFSADGQRILIGGDEPSARLWDATTGRQLGPPLPHRAIVQAAALSPDGRTAITTIGDNEALLWDVSVLPDDLPRIESWVQVRTGLAFDEEGRVKHLDDSAWRQRCERLAALGGTPEGAEPRWRLDPILFGPDPTARARAWVERKRWADAEAAYGEVVAARPLDATVLFERARFYTSRSQPEKAEPDYAHAYALGSRDPQLIESIVGSEALLRRTIAETPGATAPLLAQHAMLMVSQARWQDAAADFAQELDLLPRDRYWQSARSKRALEMARQVPAYEWLLKLRPDDGHLWCVRGRFLALRGEWERAAADFARGIASAPPDSEEWFEHACLRLIVGDSEGYRAFVQEMRRREGQTSNPFVAYVLAQSCVVSAAPVVEPDQVIRWAEQAVKADRLPWYLGALGAAYYRAGQFDHAVRLLEESNRSYWAGGQHETDTDLFNGPMLALAHLRLGHTQAALESMRKFQQALRHIEDTRTDGAVSLNNTEWLLIQLRRREAAALIDDSVFPADPFAHRRPRETPREPGADR
jgi:eukaryotic-like serine/threonine-protein kinase